ncbi:MAG: hypothetical protein WCA20_24020 [Candidatus Sulfotelmatobacter sp.]
MGRISCTTLTLLVLASSGFTPPVAAAQPARPRVTISVYNYAYVSTELLQAAEDEALRIFQQAGVQTFWVNCLPRPEKVESNGCHFADATHLMLKILPHAISPQVRDRTNVLGDAFVDEKGVGYYAYAFYDRVQRVAEEQRLSRILLGDVLAHEIGHLLLGSKSHSVSGIMSAHWNGEELRKISEGTMFFSPSQSSLMRDRVRRSPN